MRAWVVATGVVLGLGLAGGALAQADVVAERRAGFRQMGQHLEAIGGVMQSRGDQRQIAARVDQMIPFYQGLPNRVPAASLTPPVAQGTGEGQTRALQAIDGNRADFAARTATMITLLTQLKTAAEAGTVNADLLRQVGTSGCGGCHQPYRAR